MRVSTHHPRRGYASRHTMRAERLYQAQRQARDQRRLADAEQRQEQRERQQPRWLLEFTSDGDVS